MRLGNTIAQKQAFGLVLLSPFAIFVQYRVHLQCMPCNLITNNQETDCEQVLSSKHMNERMYYCRMFGLLCCDACGLFLQ